MGLEEELPYWGWAQDGRCEVLVSGEDIRIYPFRSETALFESMIFLKVRYVFSFPGGLNKV